PLSPQSSLSSSVLCWSHHDLTARAEAYRTGGGAGPRSGGAGRTGDAARVRRLRVPALRGGTSGRPVDPVAPRRPAALRLPAFSTGDDAPARDACCRGLGGGCSAGQVLGDARPALRAP